MNTTILRLLFLLIVLLVAPPLHAQSQHEMNQEARESFEKADAELNKLYKKIIADLDDQGREKLRIAQRAWVIFRDAQADYEADAEARGGSMEPMIYSGTQARLTKARIAQLQPSKEN